MSGATGTWKEEDLNKLDELSKGKLRFALVETSGRLIGVKYVFGAEWKDYAIKPSELDCSEMVEGIFIINGLKMPDGSQNQFDFTVPVANPQIGDLAFMGKSANTKKIYHVGMIYDDKNIIEARAFDEHASFKTGEVILRPRERWENWKNFVGYRAHPKLA